MDQNLVIIETLDRLEALQDYLADKHFVAYDTETNGTDADSHIIGISVAAESEVGFYVKIAKYDKETDSLIFLPIKDNIPKLLQVLQSKQLIMHNAIFDCIMTKSNYGIDLMPSLHTDTLILAHLLDENRSNGLKELGTQIFGDDARQEQIEVKESVIKNGGVLTKAKYELYKADSDLLAKYGAKDAILTIKLFYHLVPILYEEDLDKFFYEDESMPLLRTTTYDLNRIGLKVDPIRLSGLKGTLEAECMEAKAFIYSEIQQHIKDKYKGTSKATLFNIDSSKQLSWLLFFKLDNDFVALTEEGRTLAKALNLKVPYNPKARREFVKTVIQNKDRIYQPAIFNRKTQKMSRPKKVGEPWNYIACGKDTLSKYAQKYKWVAKLLEYKKNQKLLVTYVIGIQDKLKYGIIRPSFLQHGTTSGRYSSKHPNFQNLPREDKRIKSCIVSRPGKLFVAADFCLDPSTELLTPEGWKNVMDLTDKDQVWQVEKDTLLGSFVKPKRIIKRQYEGLMYYFGNNRGGLRVTSNHTMLFSGQNHKTRLDKPNKRKVQLSQYGIPCGNASLIPYSESNTTSEHTNLEIWKACAIQADGSIVKGKDRYRIQVSAPRKRTKLTKLFGLGKPAGYIRQCHTLETENWLVTFKSDLLTTNKGLDLSRLGSEHADVLVSALSFWDGSKPEGSPNRVKFYSTDECTIDSVQSYLVRSGWEARKSCGKHGCFTLSIRKESRIRLVPSTDFKSELYSGPVGCVTVDTGFILTRYQGQTVVTGNCQLEPRVFASFSEDFRLLNGFKKGEDFYSVIGAEVFGKTDLSLIKDDKNSFAKLHPDLRQISKVIALSATYGTTAPKMAGAIGCSIQEAQEVIDNYFENFPSVEKLMKDSHNLAKDQGKVSNLFGRLRRMPEALKIRDIYKNKPHNELPYEARNTLNLAVNHRIQSTGASIVNRASIAFNRRIAEEHIRECHIVIQIHDEIVVECIEKDAERVSQILKESMEKSVILPGVDLIAEPKIANNLADLK